MLPRAPLIINQSDLNSTTEHETLQAIDENLLAYRFIIYGFIFYPVILYMPIIMYGKNYRFFSVLKFIYSILLVIMVIRFYRFFLIGGSSMPMPLLSVQDLLLYPVFIYFI